MDLCVCVCEYVTVSVYKSILGRVPVIPMIWPDQTGTGTRQHTTRLLAVHSHKAAAAGEQQ